MSGTTLRGLIKLNDTLLLGPDPLGNFLPIAVKSIHRKRMPVKEVRGGQTASFALKKVRRAALHPQSRSCPSAAIGLLLQTSATSFHSTVKSHRTPVGPVSWLFHQTGAR